MADPAPNSTRSKAAPAERRVGAEAAILTCAALAWTGLSISILLIRQHRGNTTFLCPNGAGCEAVLSSKYATVAGVPLPWLGVIFYALLLALLLVSYAQREAIGRVRMLSAVLWLSVMGASFSAVLMFLQFAVLHAFCPLCTGSAGIMLALAVASGLAEARGSEAAFLGRRAGALALGFFAALAAAAQLLPRAVPRSDVLATVDGREFTRAQMEEESGAPAQALRQALYDQEFAWVREKVDGALLAAEAAKTGQDPRQMLAAQEASVSAPTPEEIAARRATKGLADTPENTASVQEELLTDAREQVRTAYLEKIATGHRIEVLLEQPKVLTLQIDLATAQVSGPRDARVQVVVFSDFDCHFCRDLAPVLKKVRADFPKDVLLAYRYFPIEAHARALPAAIAAQCAAEQGAFWDYHDALFAGGNDLSDARLLALAEELHLDRSKFVDCQNSGAARAKVEASRADALASGLPGAPSVFLNGKLVTGRIDYDLLAARVREVLAVAPGPN